MGKKRQLTSTSIIPTESNALDKTPHSDALVEELPADNFPLRSTERLYACQETLNCALHRGCVPCVYKIGCFDVALDKEFCRATPNQRPEQCPRSRTSLLQKKQHPQPGVMGFCRGMSILTVGDGDFTFSLGLARRLTGKNEENQQSRSGKNDTFLVATSYESESTLRKVYPDFDETLNELQKLGVHVGYNVDATRILETLSSSSLPNTKMLKQRFHRICWNFPCTAIGGGQDGQNKAMEENKELVRGFVESSRQVLSPDGDGELYVCHKTKPPYNQWKLETVALEKQKVPASTHKKVSPLLYFSGRIVLDRFLLPPYTPRKALDKKSFPCHDACFYVFAQKSAASITIASNNQTTTKKKKIFKPTIPRNKTKSDSSRDETASPLTTLVKIESNLLRLIRQKHMNASANSRKKKKQKTKHKQKRSSIGSRRF